MNNFLTKPYPLTDNVIVQVYWDCFSDRICDGLFGIFQPFELYNISEQYKWTIILGYGGVTAIVEIILLIVMMPALRSFFKKEIWTKEGKNLGHFQCLLNQAWQLSLELLLRLHQFLHRRHFAISE